jgi:heme-degrading monooxygenase HmoA
MILEQAVFAVTPGSEGDFEVAAEQAKEVIAMAAGFRSLKLLRGIEQPATYLLLNEWETLQHHLSFRESELFLRWRELIGPYFASPPVVEHFDAAVVTRDGGA